MPKVPRTIRQAGFGGPLAKIANENSFLAQVLEKDLKVFNLNARMYDPLGRQLLSPDLAMPFAINQIKASIRGGLGVGSPGMKQMTYAMNPYQYGNQNPISWSDPSGNSPGAGIAGAYVVEKLLTYIPDNTDLDFAHTQFGVEGQGGVPGSGLGGSMRFSVKHSIGRDTKVAEGSSTSTALDTEGGFTVGKSVTAELTLGHSNAGEESDKVTFLNIASPVGGVKGHVDQNDPNQNPSFTPKIHFARVLTADITLKNNGTYRDWGITGYNVGFGITKGSSFKLGVGNSLVNIWR